MKDGDRIPPRLTPLRLDLLRTIARRTRDGGGPPSAAELARATRLTEATISAHLRALRELGYVERHGPRGRLLLTARALNAARSGIPVYGHIAAGPPGLAESSAEQVTPSLDALLDVQDGDFLLRVRGESMTGIGIMDGDYVLVRPAADVLDGEVAVVLIPGEDSATLKRLYRFVDRVILEAENPAVDRLSFPAGAVQVQGRMVARLGLGAPRRSASRRR
ncbi:transcriptional repressor LexA [Deinococcus rufus]|uniref:Transcriptional repressor LexA n=1 Tax=Deinococcus rufus TaxID=2136097 RepID=A0ABV7ZCD5_9DEIO